MAPLSETPFSHSMYFHDPFQLPYFQLPYIWKKFCGLTNQLVTKLKSTNIVIRTCEKCDLTLQSSQEQVGVVSLLEQLFLAICARTKGRQHVTVQILYKS